MSLNYARFTVAYWCVLIAALLPYACTYLAKYQGFGKPRSKGGFDNVEPRAGRELERQIERFIGHSVLCLAER